MWYGSGAPFDPVLQVIAVCSVLAVLVVFPVLEVLFSGVVSRSESSAPEASKGARMIREVWIATKNVCYGLTGGFLILTRRNDLLVS